MSRCAVMPKIILLMMIVFSCCHGFPLLSFNDEDTVVATVTVTTTESDFLMSNESEIVTNSTASEAIEMDNNHTFSIIFNANTSQVNDTFELIPIPARLATFTSNETICVSPSPSLWFIQQNITKVNKKMNDIEKIITKIGSDMTWLRIANYCSAVLSASCIAPVLVILCRLKLPAPTI